jgi:integrase/recombinase XerC
MTSDEISGTWTHAIEAYVEHRLDVGLGVESAKAYRYRLRTMAAQLTSAPWDVDATELRVWFASTEGLRPDTRRGYRTAVRGFYRWAAEAGHVSASPALGLRRVPPPPPMPRPVPDDVYAAALRAARNDDDRLWLRLMAEHGLRRGEIAVIRLPDDLVRDLGGWSLCVHGKGGKERVVPLTAPVARRLQERPSGWAFPGGKDGHVSPWWVGRRMSRILGDYTGHKLRHRAGSRWNDLCEDLAVVQDLLGHADPRTTRLYVASNRVKMRRVVEDAA